MTQFGFFAHERLDAYKAAREFLALAARIAKALPRGHADDADQLMRAARSAMRNCAEGAGRRAGKEKARFFDIARGSATECVGTLDALAVEGLIAPAAAARGRDLLGRVVCMLTALARSSIERAG